MTLYVNKRVRVIPNNITRVLRKLEGEGKIFVQPGQEVSPSDIIGQSSISAGFRNINLATALSVEAKEVKKHLQRALGKPIYKGELLAYKGGGIFGKKKIVTSPTDGILELLDEQKGILKLKILPQKSNLAASVFGIVEQIDHIKKQILIRTETTQIYGIAGSGRFREGYLEILGDRGDLIDNDKFSHKQSGKIIVGGGFIYNRAITQAVAFGVSGIITGGIDSGIFIKLSGGRIYKKPRFESDVGISILVTEGFGLIPIGQDIFELFQKYNDKLVILEGNEARVSLPSFDSDCILRIRKTELGPAENLIEPAPEGVGELKRNENVRVIGDRYMGEQGQVEAVDKSVSVLPSGVLTFMVTIVTKSRKIRVPYSNLEIIN